MADTHKKKGERPPVGGHPPSTTPTTRSPSAASSRGVAFSGEPSRERASSRVHFDDKLHDSVITVAAEDDGSFLVKLQHRYEMAFTLPELPSLGENVCLAPVSSPHLRVVDISPAPEGGLRLTCEYLAQEAGVLCERLRLLSRPERDAGVTVKVHARVMGGTGRSVGLGTGGRRQAHAVCSGRARSRHPHAAGGRPLHRGGAGVRLGAERLARLRLSPTRPQIIWCLMDNYSVLYSSPIKIKC
ncbi:adipose-secreted signaling protein isoform X2 [Stigmatopora nigra]